MSELQPAKLLPFPGAGETRAAADAGHWVSADPASEALLRQLARLAPTGAPVLLLGETGTGKEMAARYLHEHSRRQGPFVAVNCGAFNESLVEAELFGHEAGAFTGAQHSRAGWFEAANGGTLFLDEIGDMPVSLQVKLLRALQERQVVRLGSRRPVSVDVRIVAATHADLAAAVRAGRFRADLYYRLNVAPVRMCALRDRRVDILPLAHQFMELYRRRLGLDVVRLPEHAAGALLAYDWPGNVRELENVIHYALIMSRDGCIDVADLRLAPPAADPSPGIAKAPAAPRDGGDALPVLASVLRRLLQGNQPGVYESVERLLVATAFEHCGGNQVHTARRLGISRNVLRAQLKRFGLLTAVTGADEGCVGALALAPP